MPHAFLSRAKTWLEPVPSCRMTLVSKSLVHHVLSFSTKEQVFAEQGVLSLNFVF